MLSSGRSSRLQYRAYRRRFIRKRQDPKSTRTLPPDTAAGQPEDRPTHRPTGVLVSAFLKQLRGHYRLLSVILLTSAVGTVLTLVPLYGMKVIVDNVFGGKPLPSSLDAWPLVPRSGHGLLWAVVSAMFVTALIAVAVRTAGNRMAFRLQRHLILKARRRLLRHALRMRLHRLREITSGGMSFIVRHDANAFGDLVMFLICEPWKAVVQLLGCFIMLAWIDWRLLLGAMALLPIVYLSQKAKVGRIRDMVQDTLAEEQRIDGMGAEVFGGIRVIRGFGRERTVAARLARRHHYVSRLHLFGWWLRQTIQLGWSVVIPLASGLLLGFGGMMVLRDQAAVAAGTLAPGDAFTVGALVMFVAYLAWLLNPLASIARTATHLQNAFAGLNRGLDILDEPLETANDDARPVDRSRVRGDFAMRGVWFTYPGSEQPALRGIDLDARAGQVIALVGTSGAGKTTLTNLIARFHEPDRGELLLDGRPVRDIEVTSYRRALAVVEQDIFLFDGTIAENIACGNRHATRAQIVAAAEQACADGFIDAIPEGYDTPLGERGLRLSGGQRQRIAIARAILADPRILILDEATSHLDPENERLIQRSLASLMDGRTCFVIAHRLSTIRHADQILVLEAGRLVERGRHDELMLRSPRYQRMIALQMGGDDDAALQAAG